MPWYSGPTLMHHLENVAVGDDLAAQPFRLPVQWVNRPDADFRGFAGLIVSGGVTVGDAVRVLPSGRQSHVRPHRRRRPRLSRPRSPGSRSR